MVFALLVKAKLLVQDDMQQGLPKHWWIPGTRGKEPTSWTEDCNLNLGGCMHRPEPPASSWIVQPPDATLSA